MEMAAGIHILAELWDCRKELLERVEPLKQIFDSCVEEAGLRKVGEAWHQFEPFGVTGIILISESHVSVHTWPEKSYCAVDIFTCGDSESAKKAFELIRQRMAPGKVDYKEIPRG